MSLAIFVPGVGQHENIGDIILRRQLLRRLRDHGHLHIYVGSSTDDYDQALGISDTDRLYRSFRRWYAAALRQAALGKATYVFKPGEIQLTLPGMKEHLAMLPVVALARMRGKPVIRVGTGSRNFAAVPRFLLRPSISLSTMTRWRDTRTAAYLSGRTMPDLAFAEGSPRPRDDRSDRDTIVVSMRSDRATTPQLWVDAVRALAERHQLRIVAISQVIRDNPKTAELAHRLGADALLWDGGRHGDREALLRAEYQRSVLTVSDRLHVLIAAFTEGSVPAALLTDGSDKIARHFAAAGISGIALTLTSEASSGDVTDWLDAVTQRRDELLDKLDRARHQIDQVFDEVHTQFSGRLETRPLIALQVGRRGEIAGGMTQVINTYLDTDFPHFQPQLLQSRGASNPVSALAIYLRAVMRLMIARHADRTVLVVHLSQGGSFLREGSLLRLGRARGYTVVAQLHGSSFAAFAARRAALVGSVLRKAHGVHVLSDESAAAALELAPHTLLVQIPNAVPGAQVRSKERLVVFGGAVTHRKGADLLIEAWEALSPRGWRLVIAGPVQEPGLIPDPLPAGIEVPGPVAHGELMALLESAAIAVLPSRDEAMPMFLIEAMARENAIISTTVGGIPSLVTPEAGVLVPPGGRAELQAALAQLLADPAATASLQRGAREVFEQSFSARVVTPQVDEFWLAARERRRSG